MTKQITHNDLSKVGIPETPTTSTTTPEITNIWALESNLLPEDIMENQRVMLAEHAEQIINNDESINNDMQIDLTIEKAASPRKRSRPADMEEVDEDEEEDRKEAEEKPAATPITSAQNTPTKPIATSSPASTTAPESFLHVVQPSPSTSLDAIENPEKENIAAAQQKPPKSPKKSKSPTQQQKPTRKPLSTRVTSIIGDSHAHHWEKAKNYVSAFPAAITKNTGKSGATASKIAKLITEDPAHFLDNTTKFVVISIGGNDIQKSPTDVIANNVENIAIAARDSADDAEIVIMHIPPLRQNAINRQLHEIYRLQINKELDEWSKSQPRIRTIALPKKIDSGAATNYLHTNDPVHFNNDANAITIKRIAEVSQQLLLS